MHIHTWYFRFLRVMCVKISFRVSVFIVSTKTVVVTIFRLLCSSFTPCYWSLTDWLGFLTTLRTQWSVIAFKLSCARTGNLLLSVVEINIVKVTYFRNILILDVTTTDWLRLSVKVMVYVVGYQLMISMLLLTLTIIPGVDNLNNSANSPNLSIHGTINARNR